MEMGKIHGHVRRVTLIGFNPRHILDQKQDGIASRKSERNQKIVFSLWRVQFSTFLKIYGVIQICAQ